MRYLLFAFILLSLSFGGEELYKRHCSSCHGEDRLGKSAPPLLPPFFISKSDDYLYQVIKKGTVGMPSFGYLRDEEIKAILEFIKRPVDEEKITWGVEKIRESKETLKLQSIKVRRLWDYTVVVERGKSLLWIMEGDEVLAKIPFSDIHGGIKFSKEGDVYIPSRSGWIGKYSPKEGKLEKVRACIYLRNIALSENLLVASCWLPSSLVLFDKDLNLIQIKKVEGRINAVYELNTKKEFIFTFRDKPYVGFLREKDYQIVYKNLDTFLEDFTLDPLEEYLIGTSKEGLRIYSLKDLKLVKSLNIHGLPHLASSHFWYSKGDFYFATPIIRKPLISIWKAYTWEHVKDISLEGLGFLARSNYGTPYLWVDESSDSIALVDKRSFDVKRIKPLEGKKAVHTELSGNGKLAYVSLYEEEGCLVIYDGVSLKKLKEYPASLPAGKYNFVNKSRRFDAAQLGYQVFMEKCWGCHHTTRQAFGPSLRSSIQNRDKALIIAQILDPENAYRLLGYTRNAMPRINLRDEELKALINFMEVLKDGWMD
ncbi:MAG: cytochrome D1 domain-containing protein [Aquificaceae bacterium]